jgi:hypothetical protein
MHGNLVVSFFLALALLLFSSCDQGTEAVELPQALCQDPDSLQLMALSPTPHKGPKIVTGKDTTLAGTEWTGGDSVRAFFGGKDIKVVFVLNKSMYLLTYAGNNPVLTRISQNDEGLYGGQGAINSPLFSPDGRKILFAGTTRGKPAFVQDAVAGGIPSLRVPVDPKGHTTAEPHWHSENGKTYVYFATLPGLIFYDKSCGQIPGATYRREMLNDSTFDSTRTTGIPGAYRGGISRDGLWAGTSYATSVLFDMGAKKSYVLAGEAQQCNPSMNPYPPGSKHNDYMLILAFGGLPAYKLIDGRDTVEGLHENLWIYNKDDKIVWQAAMPDKKYYLHFDKPEWSTHPDFATAVILVRGKEDADLFALKIGDLANAEEGKLNQAQGYLRIGKGGFNSDTYSHLWVAP